MCSDFLMQYYLWLFRSLGPLPRPKYVTHVNLFPSIIAQVISIPHCAPTNHFSPLSLPLSVPPYFSLRRPFLKVQASEPFASSLLHYFSLSIPSPLPRLSQRRAAVGFHYSTSQSSSRCPLFALVGSNTLQRSGVRHLHYSKLKQKKRCKIPICKR